MSKIDPKHLSNLIATDVELTDKVDKIAGKGLSTEDYTTVEKSKLAGVASGATANNTDANLLSRVNHTGTQLASTISNFSAAALAVIVAGLSTGTSSTVLSSDSILAGIGKLQAQINTLISSKYDASNPSSYETTSQLNTRDTNNRARANHTGTQVSSTISDFLSSVLNTGLTGLSTATNAIVNASDSLIVGVGKLQAQITGHQGVAGTTHPTATTSVSGFMSAADKAKLDTYNRYEYRLTSTQATNSATHSNVTALQSGSLPIGTYEFKLIGKFQSAATNTGMGLRLVNGSATISDIIGRWEIEQAANGTDNCYSYSQTTTTTNISSISVVAANTNYTCFGSGMFTVTAAGTVGMQFRSESGGTNVTLGIGTQLIIRQID